MLVVVERSLGRRGIVLGPLEALLELAVQQLALLALGAELLLEALLALRGLRAELVEGGAQIVDGSSRRRRLVRDDGSKLRVERELGLAARALDGERRVGHGAKLAVGPQGRQAVRQCRRWAISPTSFPGPAVGTTPFRNVGGDTSITTTARGAGGTRALPRTSAVSTSSSSSRRGSSGRVAWCTTRSRWRCTRSPAAATFPSSPSSRTWSSGCAASGGARRPAGEGRPVRGEPARAGGDAAHVERRAAGGDQGAAAPLGALDEGVPGGSGRERRGDRRLREGRRPENLPMV